MLEAYFNLRVTAFKKIEELAPSFIESYNCRQLLDGISLEDLNIYNFAYIALYDFRLDGCISITSSQNLEIVIIIIEMAISYLNGESVDITKLNAIKPEVEYLNYSIVEIYQELCNAINNRNNGLPRN